MILAFPWCGRHSTQDGETRRMKPHKSISRLLQDIVFVHPGHVDKDDTFARGDENAEDVPSGYGKQG